MRIESLSGATTPNAAHHPPRAGGFSDVLDRFLKAAYQTPAERAREAVLEEHGLDEATYNALPPRERAAIDAEIAEAVRRVTERDTGVPMQDRGLAATLQMLARI